MREGCKKVNVKVLKSSITTLFIFCLLVGGFPNITKASNYEFITPLQGGYITYGYMDPNYGGPHYGIDYGHVNKKSTPIIASANGTVTRASGGCIEGNTTCNGGYGNVVYITHNINGQIFTTVYAHLDSISTSLGRSVAQGDVIGRMGNTGYSLGVHLHFELHKGDWTYRGGINPATYLNKDLSPTPPKNTSPESVYHVIQVSNPQWGLYREAGNDSSKYIESLKNFDKWYMVVNKQQWVNGTLYFHIIRGTTDYGWTAASQVRTIAPEWITVHYDSQGYDRATVSSNKIHKIPAGSEVRKLSENDTMILVNYNNFPQWIEKNPPKNTGVESTYHAVQVVDPKWGLYKEAGNDSSKYIESLKNYDRWYMVANKQQWVNGTLYYHLKMGEQNYGWTAAEQLRTISPVNIEISKDTQGYYRATQDLQYRAHLIPAGTTVRVLGEGNGMVLVLYRDFPQYVKLTN